MRPCSARPRLGWLPSACLTVCVLVGDSDRIAALTDWFATIRDVDRRWSTVGLYEVTDQQIAACWLLPLDQRAFDAIWSV